MRINKLGAYSFVDFPNLEQLELEFFDAYDSGEQHVDCSGLERLHKLKKIAITLNSCVAFTNNESKQKWSLLWNPKKFTYLSELFLTGFKVDLYTLKSLENLVSLQLEECELVNLKVNAFSEKNKLTRLYLTDCDLLAIDDDLFIRLDRLEEISLSRNGLITWDPNKFCYFSCLKKLFLQQNSLSIEDANFLACFKNLVELDLSSNCLIHFDSKLLFANQKLQVLNISRINALKLFF